jgi:hypothetical protein
MILALSLVWRFRYTDTLGNSMDWQPREAIKGEGEELQSISTVEEVETEASKILIDDDDDVVDMDGTIIVDVE